MSKVEVNNDGSIITIILNRPEKRNALDQEMLDSLYEIFSAKVSVDARAIVLRANGPSFCAGIDLKEKKEKKGGLIWPNDRDDPQLELLVLLKKFFMQWKLTPCRSSQSCRGRLSLGDVKWHYTQSLW